MGFIPEAQYRTYDVTHQGIHSIKDFGQLNDESFKTLCKVLHRPVGTVTVGGAQMFDNVVAILAMSKTNFQGMVHFIRHYDRIAGVIVPSYITLCESAKYVSPTRYGKQARSSHSGSYC